MQTDDFSSEGSEESYEQQAHIKLELRTPLESFLRWMSFISGFVLVAGLMGYLEDGWTNLTRVWIACGAIGFSFFFCLYYNTDNYYILDLPGHRLLYHFKFFFYKNVSVASRFADIASVTVSGEFKRSKHGSWWNYQTLIIDNTGRVFPLSDMEREALSKNQELAKQISQLTQAGYVEGAAEMIARPALDAGGRYTFNHVKHTWLDSLKEISILLICLLLFVAATTTMIVFSEPILKQLGNLFK